MAGPIQLGIAQMRDPRAAGATEDEPPEVFGVPDPDDEPRLGPEGATVEDTEDGGLLYTFGDPGEDFPELADAEFYANLADGLLQEDVLDQICQDLIERIEADKEARKARDERQAKGLEEVGMVPGKEPGGAEFEGASKVIHPALPAGCIDFAARTIDELFPVEGPVRPKIIGDQTDEKSRRADRKAKFFNWALTEQIKEYRDELNQTLTQTPLGGSQFMYFWWDHQLRRPRAEFVPIDAVHLQYSAASFYGAARVTYEFTQTEVERRAREDSGEFIDLDTPAPSTVDKGSDSQEANDKIEGKEASQVQNYDGECGYYRTFVLLDIPSDTVAPEDRAVPYQIVINKDAKKIVGVFRNWEEDDPTLEQMDSIVEFAFLRWRGAYAIGLLELASGIHVAATGALRALLDTAHLNNEATAIRAENGSIGGQDVQLRMGSVTSVKTSLMQDDIRKAIMPIPVNSPSAVLYQLLLFLDEKAGSIVRTSLDATATDSNANTPVGTQMSRVEQGLKVYGSIHTGLHFSQARVFKILHRLYRQHAFRDTDEIRVGEDVLVRKEDFDGGMDVIPVSDPRIFSDQQRWAQFQGMLQLRQSFPDLPQGGLKSSELLKLGVQLLKLPNADRYLAEIPEPQKLPPHAENVRALLGKPIEVYDDDDPIAHLRSHVDFLSSILARSPLVPPGTLAPLLPHIQKHMLQLYSNLIDEAIDQVPMASRDMAAAQAGTAVIQQINQEFMPLLQSLAQIAQTVQQALPKPPMDPSQAAMAEVQRKQQKDQQDAAAKQMDAKMRGQMDMMLEQFTAQTKKVMQQAELNFEMWRQNAIDTAKQLDNQVKLDINNQDNVTALTISEGELAAGHKSALSTGTGIGQQR